MPSSSRVTWAATAASSPNGLGIAQSAANVSFSRAFSASLARRIAARHQLARKRPVGSVSRSAETSSPSGTSSSRRSRA